MRDTMNSLPMPDVPSSVPNGAGSQAAAIGAFVASLAGWLPYFFAALPAIYYIILIWESKTVQGLVERRRQRRLVKETARLRAKALVLNAQVAAGEKVADAKVVASTMVDEAAVDAQVLLAKTDVALETKPRN
jgi:hypothetical protein